METDCVALSSLSTSPPYLHEPSTVLSSCLISHLAEGRPKTMACYMAVSGSKNRGLAEGRQKTMECYMAVSGSKNRGMLAENNRQSPDSNKDMSHQVFQ